MDPTGAPTMRNGQFVRMDNSTAVGVSAFAPPSTMPPSGYVPGFSLNDAFPIPTLESSQQEDSTMSGTTVPLKIAPFSDDTMERMTDNDLLYVYNAAWDINNQYGIHTTPPVWKLNAGCKARANSEARDRALLQMGGNKAPRTGPDRGRIFPLTAEEYKQKWTWLGVLSQLSPKHTQDLMSRPQYDTNRKDAFRPISVKVWTHAIIATLICENVRNHTTIYEVGRVVDCSSDRNWDARGRNVGPLSLQAFRMEYMTTDDNGMPRYCDLLSALDRTETVTWSNKHPITDKVLPFQFNEINVNVRTVELPVINPRFKIKRVYGRIPTQQEISQALYSSEAYRQLEHHCYMEVHPLAQGFGPWDNIY